ncbi:50S ribosomal protein L9 [Lancefieldella sp. Marseille-Q7238]|uniref:50S ribosomal protein L9 n=1 Tax=Lancefieldella sp. Marseille-Q7238 TaxID=3022127 RepID=UPI0024A96026|nr:50S ribosomal protein L9 [Lancefieldella sp. Marseille-Q7238]
MKVILLGELRGKGGEGDIVEVAQGYAENFLFPQKIAQPATPGNIKQLEERRHNIAKREAERLADAEATKAALDGKLVTVDAKIGEERQLFGSVTPAQIANAIKDQLGVEIDRKRIVHSAAIKTAGRHKVIVDLYREVEATVSVQVGPEEAAEEVEPAVAVNESIAVESEEVVSETETEKAETTE